VLRQRVAGLSPGGIVVSHVVQGGVNTCYRCLFGAGILEEVRWQTGLAPTLAKRAFREASKALREVETLARLGE